VDESEEEEIDEDGEEEEAEYGEELEEGDNEFFNGVARI
jgi:hypothetical protein